MLRKIRFDLFMPYLIGLYPLTFFYGMNFYIIESREFIITVMICLVVAAVLTGITSLVLRSLQRGSFVTGLLLALFYLYGHIFELVQDNHIRYFPFDKHPGLLALWGFLATAGIILAIKRAPALPTINRWVGMITGLLLVVAIGNIGVRAISASPPPDLPDELGFEVQPSETLRDVYFIVLDEYAGNTSLINNLGFDNSQFLDALESLDFLVMHDARSNYYKTQFSLASVLNMRYLDDLYGKRGEDMTPLVDLIMHNQTAATFKKLGYTYVHFATEFTMTRTNPLADIVYDGYNEQRIQIGPFELNPKTARLSDYHIAFGKTTLLLPFMDTIELNDSRIRMAYNLEKLVEIPKMQEPTFTFAHFILPHVPYAFGRDEGPVDPALPVDGEVIDRAKYEAFQDYIDQLIYTNRVISQAVKSILEQSSVEPIIIVQGDHGFRWVCSDCYAASQTWDATYYSQTMLPILEAYYLPDGGETALYPNISPVNTFRVIFDYYFGAELSLLDDRYFMPENYYPRPFFFVDITETVHDFQQDVGGS